MKIEIIGRNYNPSDSLKSVTEKKCAKLARRLKKETDAEVKFTVELANEAYTTDAALTAYGQTYRAEAKSDSPFDNLDTVVPKLLGQLGKQKSIWGKNKKGTPNKYPEEE